jgi:ribose 5-phosphate isomerase B
MQIVIGADWVGFHLKEELIVFINDLGHKVVDVGGYSDETNDYPDIAEKAGKALMNGEADTGVLICGTGLGMSIAANKIKGVRAALCHNAFTTSRSRGHNDANVLVFGALIVSSPHAQELLQLWLETSYEEGRHVPRIVKINRLEGTD